MNTEAIMFDPSLSLNNQVFLPLKCNSLHSTRNNLTLEMRIHELRDLKQKFLKFLWNPEIPFQLFKLSSLAKPKVKLHYSRVLEWKLG